MSEEISEYSIQSLLGFRTYYDDKSPLLYTYLIDRVASSEVANELLLQIFFKLYKYRKQLKTIPHDFALILITKKNLIEYFEWRQTEIGQQALDQQITLDQCKELAITHTTELNEWAEFFNDLEQEFYHKVILEKPNLSLIDKYKDIKENEGSVGVFNRIKEWADKNGKQSK